MIALYCRPQAIREQIEQLLPANQCQPVDSRSEFHRALVRFGAGVFGALRFDRTDAEWIARLVDHSLHVACVAVLPLSLEHLQSFRPILSDRLKVVWLEEAREQLSDIVRQTPGDHDNPLHRLALGVLTSRQLSPLAKKTLEEICCPRPTLSDDMPLRPVPPRNMEDLACRVHHSISGIRVHWREHIPLRCTPKKLMEWAMLMWAASDRVLPSASAQARYMGIHPRTLERICARLIGCRMSEARADPQAVRHLLEEWLDEVLEPPLHALAGGTGGTGHHPFGKRNAVDLAALCQGQPSRRPARSSRMIGEMFARPVSTGGRRSHRNR